MMDVNIKIGSELCFAQALLFGVIAAALPLASSAQTFSNPVQLSFNANATTASAAIDGNGNSLVVWADGGVFFSMHRPGSNWTPPAPLSPSVVPGASATLKVNAAGTVSLMSYASNSGIWVADKPAGGAWHAAVEIAMSPNLVLGAHAPLVQFLSDTKGDQAVIYEDYANAGYRLMAVRRRAGAAGWSLPETILTSLSVGYLSIGKGAIGESGDVVVTWESFLLRCSRYCHETNFVVHAVRAPAASAIWSDSGPLTSPSTPSYSALSAIDPNGRAVVFTTPPYLSIVQANTQAAAGATWSSTAIAFRAPSGYGVYPWDAATNGSAPDVASFVVSALSSGAASIDIVDGNLMTNGWSAGTNLAALDTSGAAGTVTFGANSAGGAIAEWTDSDGTVRAAFRQSIAARWALPQTLAMGSACSVIDLQCTVPVAAVLDARGDAVALFNRSDANDTTHTLYAVTK